MSFASLSGLQPMSGHCHFRKHLIIWMCFQRACFNWPRSIILSVLYFKWEAKRLAAFERTIYKDFDKHTIISRQDRDRLRLATHDQIMVIPNGVDPDFKPKTDIPTDQHTTLSLLVTLVMARILQPHNTLSGNSCRNWIGVDWI